MVDKLCINLVNAIILLMSGHPSYAASFLTDFS